MGWWIEEGTVEVDLAECRCPGDPHPEGDKVWLRKELTPQGALAAISAITGIEDTEITERLGRVYVEHGIVSWSFLDEDGSPVPVTLANIRRLKWDAIYPIADKASLLYSDGFFRPLRPRPSRSSQDGRTRSSISRSRPRSSRPHKR